MLVNPFIDEEAGVIMSLGKDKAASRGRKLGMEEVQVYQLRTLARGQKPRNPVEMPKAPAVTDGSSPDSRKEQIASIDAAKSKTRNMLETIEAREKSIRATNLNSIKAQPPSKNVTIAYPLDNGTLKIVDMGDRLPPAKAKPTKKELDAQFRRGAAAAEGNLSIGQTGFIRMPNGTIYEVSNSFRAARIVKD